MDRRRLTGLIALLVLVAVVGALLYFDMRATPRPPTTAFAPAQSADESVPPPDTAAAPQVESPAAAPAGEVAAAPEAAPTSETEVALGDPTPSEPTPAGAVMPPIATVPSFDVVRVEPSGQTVIAGQSEPNATVEILDGPTAIATAQANERGEWAVALDAPLAPGAHDLAVRTTSPDKAVAILSDQRVTVSVPDAGSSDVLVVLNTPDEASRVLQVAPAADGETAAADGQAAPAGEPAPSGQDQVAMVQPAEPPADRETLTPPAAAEVASAPVGEIANEPAGLDKPTGGFDKATEAPVAVEPPMAAQAPIDAEPPIVGEAPLAGEAPIPGEPGPTVIAALEEPPPTEPQVVVSAVEADTAGSLYVAGTVTTGETVRVYLDGVPIGQADPSPSGTWLVQTTKELPAGNYMVRADQIDDGGAVIARSEVPFDREIEVAILKPSGVTASSDGAVLAGAMPEMETVIIKRGDNLWRIARAAWGKGVRWSTIYQANAEQIRNPHWIYPGQIFVMPKGETTWQN